MYMEFSWTRNANQWHLSLSVSPSSTSERLVALLPCCLAESFILFGAMTRDGTGRDGTRANDQQIVVPLIECPKQPPEEITIFDMLNSLNKRNLDLS